MELKIDPEFKKLIDPLEEDEFGRLEDSIAEYGCRDAIVTWQGYIIDGHNRYTICQHLDIEPPTVDYTAQLADRDAVKQWILENQLSRRNLHTFQKSEIVLKLEKIESQKAKERQLATLKQNQDSTVVQNSAPREESGKTRDIIAARAGVSHDTIDKVKAVLDSGIEPVITAARSNTVSTNAAYELTKAAQKDAALMAELQTTAPERVPEVRDRAKAAADAAMRDIERQEKESANEKQLESEPEPLASTFPKTANKFIAKMVLDDGVEQYPIHDDDDYSLDELKRQCNYNIKTQGRIMDYWGNAANISYSDDEITVLTNNLEPQDIQMLIVLAQSAKEQADAFIGQLKDKLKETTTLRLVR